MAGILGLKEAKWIQEMVIYIDNGFRLKSDFTKKVIYTDNSSNIVG